MKSLLPYIAMSIVTWGAYVPCMHAAGRLLKSPARSYLMVCIAYCVVGIGTTIWMYLKGISPTVWHSQGSPLAFLGGLLGAAGALGIVLAVIRAFELKTSPLPIAPLVFCGAPIVATIIGVLLQFKGLPSLSALNWKFLLGMLMAAIGTSLVMFNAPKGH